MFQFWRFEFICGGLSMTTQNAKNLKLACCFIWKSLESKKDTDMNEIDYEWMGFWRVKRGGQ